MSILTPGKFLLEILPLYLAETERPIQTQAILSGSESFLHDDTDEPLKTIVEARAITSGACLSAFLMAKNLCSKDSNINDDEYLEFVAKIQDITIGSIDPEKNSRMQSLAFKRIWAGLVCPATITAIHDLTNKHIVKKHKSMENEEWAEGVAGLYFGAMRHCVTEDDDKRLQSNLSEDEFNERNNVLSGICQEFGKQQWYITFTVMGEVLDLMKAKGVRL